MTKTTFYAQLKKQQLGKQSRKVQPWFTGLLEPAQQQSEAPVLWTTWPHA